MNNPRDSVNQNDLDLKQSDGFFHYSSVISPARLIKKYACAHIEPAFPYVTNAFGVRVDPKFCPDMLSGHEGEVEPLPIPANWHADMAEFGATLRAVDLARDKFTMIELGCGWGCWMNNTGIAAKKRHLPVNLIGVEGDPGHIAFAEEALTVNGFTPSEYTLHHGIAAKGSGNALFPTQAYSGQSWGLEPLFDVSDEEAKNLVESGRYLALEQHALEDIACDVDRVDLLHVDIQGGELQLIPSAIDFLNKKVAYLFIGTHSRQIEGAMYATMLGAGWVLEIERPAIIAPGERPAIVVDGVQGWRNPHLLPQVDIAEPAGRLQLVGDVPNVRAGTDFSLTAKITNLSDTDWLSIGHTPVMVSYNWIAPDGTTIEGKRTRLADGVINAQESKRQLIEVTAPPKGGSYSFRLTLVQEGIRWFSPPEFSYETMTVPVRET
jgi:hypothetical protein